MKIKVNLNKELKGIEVSFSKKPRREILTVLKYNGFRWHRVKMLWYAKETKERLALVGKMSELAEEEILRDCVITTNPNPNPNQAKSQVCNMSRPSSITEPTLKKKPVNKYGVKVGDVFYDSWGYNQTNIDFYQVVALKGATTVELKPLNKKSRNIGFCSEMVKPIKDSFIKGKYKTRLVNGEDSITRRVKQISYGNTNIICIGAENLYPTTYDRELNETSYN